jgi:hypothetical protein
MPTIEIETKQLKEAIRKLPVKEKIRLVEELEKETRRSRWETLIAKIRSRIRNNPISQKEINKICEEARTELYARRLKGTD